MGKALKTEENLRAIGLLKYAVKLKPDYNEAYVAVSALYLHLDRKDEAVDALKQYAQSYPLQGNQLLARLYFQLNRYEDAVEIYKEMVSNQPANPYFRSELGALYVRLGDKESAMREYEALRPLHPEIAERLLKAINK